MKNNYSILVALILISSQIIAQNKVKSNKLDYSEYTGKGQTINGKKQGIWYFCYTNGDTLYSVTFKDGIENGEAYRYHMTLSEVKEKFFYINGKLSGEKIKYYGDGKTIYSLHHYKNDTLNGESTEYYNNGILKQKGVFINGQLNGEFFFYNKSGKLLVKNIYERGKITDAEEYYESGKLKSKSFYSDGKLTKEINYDENGNVKQ